jgi:hypothetical protein
MGVEARRRACLVAASCTYIIWVLIASAALANTYDDEGTSLLLDAGAVAVLAAGITLTARAARSPGGRLVRLAARVKPALYLTYPIVLLLTAFVLYPLSLDLSGYPRPEAVGFYRVGAVGQALLLLAWLGSFALWHGSLRQQAPRNTGGT